MSERRFVIFEDIGSDWKYAKESITESELKRRVEKINALLNYETPKSEPELEVMWNEVIYILLHGEGMAQPDTWEAWVEKMPLYKDCESQEVLENRTKDWLRQMPRK